MLDFDFDYDDCILVKIATVVGLFFMAKTGLYLAWDLFNGFRAYVWARFVTVDFVKTYGSWAVVTGGSDGIGKHYALELARRGMNIVLISRTLNKLNNVAKEIEKYGVKVEIIQVDFSLGRSVYRGFQDQLSGKDIGILVNNVGVLVPYPMKFLEMSEDQLWSHVNVNAGAILAMTKIILPGMLGRRRGAIVNLASTAARDPVPLMQVYSATKVFDEYFSEALGVEYAGSGVTIQTITPGYVSSNMTAFNEKIHTPSLLVASAPAFAASAVATLGRTKRTAGYWSHAMLTWFIDTFVTRGWFMQGCLKANQELLDDMKNKAQ